MTGEKETVAWTELGVELKNKTEKKPRKSSNTSQAGHFESRV